MDFPFAAPPAPGAAIEVAAGVMWLRMPLPFALDHINLWLVEEPAGFTLVDTGYGDAATRAIWEAHFHALLKRRPIVAIVVTHYHPDHVGNAAWIADRFGVPIAMTAGEFLTGHAVHGQSGGHALLDTSALFRAHGVDEDYLQGFEARGNRYRVGVPELPLAYRRMQPGHDLRIGGEAWRIIGGYGHSPEHAALHASDRHVLISGDMLLPRISTNISVWPAESEGDPLGLFLDSLTAFEALPDDTLVLPSHGLPFRGIAERVAQLRAHHDARLAELIAAVGADGVTAADVVPVLFRRKLDTQQRFFAVGEAIAHLNHLVAAGTLERIIDSSGRVRFSRSASAAAA